MNTINAHHFEINHHSTSYSLSRSSSTSSSSMMSSGKRALFERYACRNPADRSSAVCGSVFTKRHVAMPQSCLTNRRVCSVRNAPRSLGAFVEEWRSNYLSTYLSISHLFIHNQQTSPALQQGMAHNCNMEQFETRINYDDESRQGIIGWCYITSNRRRRTVPRRQRNYKRIYSQEICNSASRNAVLNQNRQPIKLQALEVEIGELSTQKLAISSATAP